VPVRKAQGFVYRRDHVASRRSPACALCQFQLNTLTAPTSIADIAARRAWEAVTIEATSNPLLLQCLRNQLFELPVEPPKQYGNSGALTPMDRDDGVTSQNELHASRFVEPVTGDVKTRVILRGPRSLEQIKIETIGCDHPSQGRRRRFDLTSMRGDDCDTGSPTPLFDDFVVDAFAFSCLQLGETLVTIHPSVPKSAMSQAAMARQASSSLNMMNAST